MDSPASEITVALPVTSSDEHEVASPPFSHLLLPLPPHSKQPARTYLESLSEGSKRTMRSALLTLVHLMLPEDMVTEEAIYTFPWEALRFEHTSVLRARLAERYLHSTANKHLAALRGVLKAAWHLELMTAEQYHQAASVKGIGGTSEPAGRSLGEGELRALLLACQADPTIKGCRDLAIIALLFATGVRRQELTLLSHQDYQQDTHALHVRGKGNKARTVFVEAPGAYEALDAWLSIRGDEPGPLFPRIRRGGHLVRATASRGADEQEQSEKEKVPPLGRLTEQAVYSIVVARAQEAELTKKLSTHDFRRTFVGELLDHGVDLSLAQQLAGHSSPTTTARYDRRPEAARKKAAGVLHVPAIAWEKQPESRTARSRNRKH